MFKKWLIAFFVFAIFCGSVAALIHANKEKKYSLKAFSNFEDKVGNVQPKFDANQQKRYDIAATKLDQYLKDKGFNGTVLVTDKNNVVLRKGYGYANIKDKVLTTPRTKYRIGSITKTVVAISILQLREKGKLNIEDNVNKYIPSFPADKNITLRNLLTHTSGLPDQGQGSVDAASRLKLVTWIGAQKLQFPAGTGWKYTDYNYMVLAYIVEKISNKPLAEYVKENIFTPVEMNESGMGATLPEDIFLAEGYTKKDNELIATPRLKMNWLYGCGEMYTTVEDMKRLDEAIMDGKLISKQSLSDMFTVSPARKYGFSFYIYPDYYHNHGVLAGWNTFNNFNWDKRTFVILFSNVQNGMNDTFNQEFRKLANDLIEGK
ncbi:MULTISPECIES: serine hydrolase domain-containing protein [Bacillus]|jgi:CubicO group peptidase (beta-lactamase class C family)|uniref:serine hydrolase domain-containing protein n=1 Tax=Bacillus TaxID=1386 RepID=UPI000DC46FAC|nr:MULTISPECIES: serine hydrolase domain-containing protein [Bacillus]MBJ7994806.1 beta-lactamase family protein [Bacillus cereus]MED1401528.1 serine hydrolase [Bacillus mycoides]QWH84553.1 class A beta-lactamase-related serine hydrolase [Bacillus mycoides]QWI93663.1 beta-lactamase family protein [Bacillus mycoides]RAN77860.1 penicillin-binding protein [Bacillus sp. SRB_331]